MDDLILTLNGVLITPLDYMAEDTDVLNSMYIEFLNDMFNNY